MSYSHNQLVLPSLYTVLVWLVIRHVHYAESNKLGASVLAIASWPCFLLLYTCCKTLVRRYRSSLKDLPGPASRNWLYDHAFDIFNEPLAFELTHWINERPYPNGLMHFWGLFGSEYVVPTDHESLLDVLSNHSYDFEKTSAFRRYAIRFFGDGLVSQEQDVHKENRKTYTPVFNQKAIYDVRHMITSKSTEFVDRISELCNANTAKSAVVPFSEFVSLVSLDIVSNVALGIDFETIRGKNRHIFDAYETIFASTHHRKWRFLWHNIIPPWLDRLIPSAEESQMDKAHDLLVHIIRDSTPKRLTDVEKDETHNTDFLSNLVKSGKFNEEEHMAQLVTILAAGYESTGGSLSFVIYCLAAHRDAQEILRKEITKAKNGRKALDEDEYDRLPYLNAMVMESLRLYPSFPLLLRKAIRDTTIKGRFIPKGTYIGVSPRAINYAKHIWGPDADQFNPERWLDRSDPETPKPIPSGGAPSPACMLSFGYGTRSCVGRNLATAQIKRQIALIVDRFYVDRVDERIPPPIGLFASAPPHDFPLRFTLVSC